MSAIHSDGPFHSSDEEPIVAYEAPSMEVVGNLRDLLAGGGSQLTDNTELCNVADGTAIPPECQ